MQLSKALLILGLFITGVLAAACTKDDAKQVEQQILPSVSATLTYKTGSKTYTTSAATYDYSSSANKTVFSATNQAKVPNFDFEFKGTVAKQSYTLGIDSTLSIKSLGIYYRGADATNKDSIYNFVSGTFTVTDIDNTNRIAGTFSGVAVNIHLDTLKVTNGQFSKVPKL